jgi:hypothetical protein
LAKTADQWPAIRQAYDWVHRLARILSNKGDLSGDGVRRRIAGLLGVMKRDREKAGRLSSAVDHFLKVTRSYWPGLFHCYNVPDLPRTNNALEQFFGSHRHHERRATGRKAASPGLVLRGSVRLIARAANRTRIYQAADLCQADREKLRILHDQLELRRERRAERYRFRKSPTRYLAELEQRLIQSALPT